MTIQVFCWQKAFKTNNSRAIILAGGAGYTWGKKNAGVWVVGIFLFDKVFFWGANRPARQKFVFMLLDKKNQKKFGVLKKNTVPL